MADEKAIEAARVKAVQASAEHDRAVEEQRRKARIEASKRDKDLLAPRPEVK